MRSSIPAYALLLSLAAALGCVAGGPGPEPAEPGVIQPWTMSERLARVAVGQPREQAHAILGAAPVRRPGHPEDPFPTPRRTLALTGPSGDAVQIELYVVAARPAEGCPDVHFEDVPVVFRAERVAATGWDFVERHWREWGGSLAALREARDRLRCDAPPETAAAPAS